MHFKFQRNYMQHIGLIQLSCLMMLVVMGHTFIAQQWHTH